MEIYPINDLYMPGMCDIPGEKSEERYDPKTKIKCQNIDAVIYFYHRDGRLYGNDRFYDVAMDGSARGSGQKAHPANCASSVFTGQ